MNRLQDRWFSSFTNTARPATSHGASQVIAQSSTVELNEDVLRLVLSFLTNEPCGATSIDQESVETDFTSALASAASVRKNWYRLAVDVLYEHVRLRDERACVLFARTLQTQERLAKIVLSIKLPDTIYLPCELSKRQKRASKLLGYVHETNQFAMSRALGRIMAAAVRLQSLRGPFGNVGRQGDMILAHLGVASKLQHLCIHPGTVQWTTWTGAPDWREKANTLDKHPLLEPTTLIWSNLHTLVIEGLYLFFYLDQADVARLAEAFPVLRELVIAKTSTDHTTLGSLHFALRNTLRTLVIWQTEVEVGTPLEPLFHVETSCERGHPWREAFNNLEHLTCVGSDHDSIPIPSPIKTIGTLTRLKSLGVSIDVVGKLAVLPPCLIKLTIHLRDDNMAYIAEDIEDCLDNWILQAPSLRQLVLSAPGSRREDIGDCPATWLRLQRRLEAFNIQLSFRIT